MNYSQYKLNAISEIEDYQAKSGERFTLFLNAVYKTLMKMNAGDEYPFTRHVKEENREMFVKVACLFISEGNQDYTFDENYTNIRREHPLILPTKKEKEDERNDD